MRCRELLSRLPPVRPLLRFALRLGAGPDGGSGPETTSLPDEGEQVFVIGNPLRLEGSVSDGIVSAIREVPDLGRIIQITAPVSHGNSGSPLFDGSGHVVGIVSERDVVRQLHRHGPSLLSRPVSKIMTSTVASCTKADTVDAVSALMTNNRVRHVPVLDGKKLIGIVSIGDVVKTRMEELEAEQQQLQSYITQG